MSLQNDIDEQKQDFLTALTDSVKEEKWIEDPVDGTTKKILSINYKKLWYKLQNISSPYFGEYAYILEEFVNLASDAYNNMSTERADILSQQLLRKINSHYFGIDAKSSETILDKHNNMKNMVHLLNRQEMTRKYVVKDEMSKNAVLGFLGKQEQHE
ncbi:MAG TPA: hypothetical protein VN703_10045 [Candidatus Sulfopaludibacter sp.]|nr:hypothetical protein [Candidatus Sulfopaludibacter sp.]